MRAVGRALAGIARLYAYTLLGVVLLFLLHGQLILGGGEVRPAALAMRSGWLLFWCTCFAALTPVPAGLYRASRSDGAAEAFA